MSVYTHLPPIESDLEKTTGRGGVLQWTGSEGRHETGLRLVTCFLYSHCRLVFKSASSGVTIVIFPSTTQRVAQHNCAVRDIGVSSLHTHSGLVNLYTLKSKREDESPETFTIT